MIQRCPGSHLSPKSDQDSRFEVAVENGQDFMKSCLFFTPYHLQACHLVLVKEDLIPLAIFSSFIKCKAEMLHSKPIM